MGIRILYAGPGTTVQDAGRCGYRRYGVPASGAADAHAYALANILAGNAGGEAAIESTLSGPTIEFTENCIACVTGACFAPTLNGRPVEMYRAIVCRAGDVLGLGVATSGYRGYVAFAGGVDVPLVMGSRSTYTRANLGGFQGRALRDGDELPIGAHPPIPAGISLWYVAPPEYESNPVLRVVPGPQDDLFTSEGVRTFYASEYEVQSQSDRMGVRLKGVQVMHAGDANIISDGVSAGAIQIPGEGQPIVMLADAQTTGGYPKIAHVATVDLPIAAQLRPGDKVRFRAISVDEAQELYLKRLEEYEALRRELRLLSAKAREYRLVVNGFQFDVSVAEVGR